MANTNKFIVDFWQKQITPTLMDYIRIPNKSPQFDPKWQMHGHMQKALELVSNWVEQHKPAGSQLHTVQLPQRTPVLILELPGECDGEILMYGHLDKQPEMTGWRSGLSAWEPKIEGDKLYGRGGADDGYAIFASVCALNYLQQQNVKLPRIVVLIEFSEESGSPDLPFYVDHCKEILGKPDLIICLDSGCGNFEQLWCTTSLRGMVSGSVRVDVLTEGVHSGDASGIVPSSFRVLQQILSRIEDIHSGKIKLKDLHVKIPKERIAQAKLTAKVLKNQVYNKFPFAKKTQPVSKNMLELILNRTWRPTLSYIGQEGLPEPINAGNVLRPSTSLQLSFRLPPTANAAKAKKAIELALRKKPPYKAQVQVSLPKVTTGWNAPAFSPWLLKTLEESSKKVFGKPLLFMGEGGTIPFMYMLGEKFPKAQFVVTGVLGPNSNAHGPNEFLHLPYAQKITECVAHIIQGFSLAEKK